MSRKGKKSAPEPAPEPAPEEQQDGPGRPPFQPTDVQRAQVQVLVLCGIDQDTIASIIGCDPKTLRKHFEKELEYKVLANAKVIGALYKNAMAGNVTAQIFIAKTQLGWKETTVNEHKGEIKQTVVNMITSGIQPQSK